MNNFGAWPTLRTSTAGSGSSRLLLTISTGASPSPILSPFRILSFCRIRELTSNESEVGRAEGEDHGTCYAPEPRDGDHPWPRAGGPAGARGGGGRRRVGSARAAIHSRQP